MSLSLESAPALLTIVAPEGRDRGIEKVAVDVIVLDMSASGGTTLLTIIGNHSPRRP